LTSEIYHEGVKESYERGIAWNPRGNRGALLISGLGNESLARRSDVEVDWEGG